MSRFSRIAAVTAASLSVLLSSSLAEAQTVTMTGNEIKKVRARANRSQISLPETTAVQVASLSVSAGQTDDFIVTFSSQCRLDSQGGPSMDLDTLQIFVILDNDFQLDPQGGTVYCSIHEPGTTIQASSFTFFKENVPAGAHVVNVFATVSDLNLDANVVGSIGPWTLRIDVAN